MLLTQEGGRWILTVAGYLFIQSVLDTLTVDTGSTRYFTAEFGLGLALMGALVGFVFWRQGQALDRAEPLARA